MYLDRFNLKGRVALVTGGAQGIGLACVEALSEAGAYVYIADRNLKVVREAQAAMEAKGYAGGVIEMEVTELEAGRRRLGSGDGGKGPRRHPSLQRWHREISNTSGRRDRRALAERH